MFHVHRIVWMSCLSWQSGEEPQRVLRDFKKICQATRQVIVENEGQWFESVFGVGWRAEHFDHWSGWQAWKWWQRYTLFEKKRPDLDGPDQLIGFRATKLPVKCHSIIYDSSHFRVKSGRKEKFCWNCRVKPAYLSLRILPNPWMYHLSLLQLMSLVQGTNSLPLMLAGHCALQIDFSENKLSSKNHASSTHILRINVCCANNNNLRRKTKFQIVIRSEQIRKDVLIRDGGHQIKNLIQLVEEGNQKFEWDLDVGIHQGKFTSSSSSSSEKEESGGWVVLSTDGSYPHHHRSLDLSTCPFSKLLNDRKKALQSLEWQPPLIREDFCLEETILCLTPDDCPFPPVVMKIRLDRRLDWQKVVLWRFGIWQGDRLLWSHYLEHAFVKTKVLASTICPIWLGFTHLLVLLISPTLRGEILGRVHLDLSHMT